MMTAAKTAKSTILMNAAGDTAGMEAIPAEGLLHDVIELNILFR